MQSHKVSFADIYNLPQGQVHSKIAYLKSILSQNPANKDFQQHLVKTTYTVKNIGIQGNQIGISSKRLQIKQKQKPQTPINPQTQSYNKKYLPKNLFYSQPLIPVRKQIKSEKKRAFDKFTASLTAAYPNELYKSQEFKTTTSFINHQSLKQIRKPKQLATANFKTEKKIQDKDKIQVKSKQNQHKKIKLRQVKNKKSYAQLLNQCQYQMDKKDRKFYSANKLVPLQHSQNPLFKRIIKIKSKVEDIIINKDQKRNTKSTIFLGRYSVKSRNHFTSTRKLLNSRAKDLE